MNLVGHVCTYFDLILEIIAIHLPFYSREREATLSITRRNIRGFSERIDRRAALNPYYERLNYTPTLPIKLVVKPLTPLFEQTTYSTRYSSASGGVRVLFSTYIIRRVIDNSRAKQNSHLRAVTSGNERSSARANAKALSQHSRIRMI